MPKIYLHNVVFVSLIGNPKICGADVVEAMSKIEVDCPVILGIDFQPCTLAPNSAAMFQRTLQQRDASSA